MDRQPREYGRFNVPNASGSGDVFEPKSNNDAKQRAALIEWLNSTLPNLNLTVNASDEELRTFLADGTVLCRLLNKLKLGSVIEYGNPHRSPETHSENVRKFLSALDDMRLPRFNISDLEKGSMKIILECLLTLKAHFMPNIGGVSPNSTSPTNMGSDAMRWKQLVEHFGSGDGPHGDLSPRTYAAIVAGDERRKGTSDSKLHRALRSPVMAEPSAALMHHVGQKYHEVFQIKHGGYTDLPAAKISELMKSNSLDNAPTQSLLSMVNGILDESIDRKNGEIPHRVACLLRKVVQEIERRISTQAEHLKTQNNLFKTREEKYQSRIRVLEALATGTGEESKVVPNQFDQIKTESIKVDVEKRYEDLDVELLMKENDKRSHEIEALKQELERARKRHEKDDRSHEIEALKQELEKARKTHEVDNGSHEIEALKQELEKARKTHEVDDRSHEIEALKQELEKARKTHEDRCLQMENTAKEAQLELEEKLKEVEDNLHESRVKLKELEENSEAKSQWWKKKEHLYQIFTEFQLGALRELRFTSQSVRQEVLKTYKCYSQDFDRLGPKIKSLRDAEEGYHGILRENQKLHNEIQELKGNIRVYCRIRPFFPGQSDKQSTIDYIGENGELIVVNPSKQGKEGRKSFKFNKVYGPRSTQADVYIDTQPLIQSVLDGYNVCIFAYGQTGSGKTYTMSGPDKGTEEDWGVNYRALNDLFRISQSRQSTYRYEVGVQMVEIYNEQVRDLLSNDSSQKKLGISSSSQNSGLAVPDASMCPVNAPSDVLGLMEIGFKNRARSSTAMNERSSRSHSVVTIHVSGSDMKTGASLRGSLHLVDLAGSERIDRSEVTGDRLKEAQHINKSLSALGDVIFALAQKSAHVPYRNSKLTQLLQSSLGGQAKTLMFVQLNPEAASYTETLSTLKFAERVSGVELGAARSSKEGGNVKELMEQVASLKDTIAKKDEEIERLQLLKDKNVYPSVNGEKRALRYGSPSPSTNSIKGASQRSSIKVAGAGKGESGHTEKAALIHENHSDGSDRSAEESKHRKEFLRQSSRAEGQNFSDDADILGFGDAEYGERLSDVSDSCLSVGTDTDGSVDSSVHEDAKPSEKPDKPNSTVKVARPTSKLVKDSTKVPTGIKKSVSGGTLGSKTVRKWS